jgi:aerobic C4-dicarboxylate transport protein
MSVAIDAGPAVGRLRKPWYSQLYLQVLTGVILGILIGEFFPSTGESLKPLGDVFIKLIKMMIAPIVFCTVVHGIASVQDLRKVGRIGVKALIYFEMGTTLALFVGLFVINLWRPGEGMNVDPASLNSKLIAGYVTQAHDQSAVGFLMQIIPNTIVGAFVNGDTLPVLFVAVLFAAALHAIGERGEFVLRFIDDIARILFKILDFIMKIAPFGACGAMAFAVGKFGLGTVVSLANFMLTFYTTCLLFIFVVLNVIARLFGFRILSLLRYLKEELLLVLGFSTSEPVLPRFMVKMKHLGCSESVVGLVIPTGYSFNLDGTCIYLTMALVFLSQATNTDLTIWQQIGALIILLLTSKGAAAVTGSGFIVLAATLGAVGHVPPAAIVLILGIDRFMSEARALTNFIGTAVATIIVAKWEGELDVKRMNEQFANPTEPQAATTAEA